MFDRFTTSSSSGKPFVQDWEASENPDFGGIGSYLVCAGCGGYHAVFDAGSSDPSHVVVNGDDRGGGNRFNDLPSLDSTQAGAQITRTGQSWAPGLGQAVNVTFGFRATDYNPGGTGPNGTGGFNQFTDIQIAATLLALQSWSDVANITFTRVNDTGSNYTNSATILFSNYTTGATGAAAFAYLPGSAAIGQNAGDIFVNSSQFINRNPAVLNYGMQTLTHEIGHAIGLSHPAAYNASADGNITYGTHAIYFEDSRQYTVMSYFSEVNTGGNFNLFGQQYYSAVPLIDDIAAAQRLYGANMTTRTGDTVYGFNSNADRSWFQATSASSALVFAVWDAGGNDTFDFSGYSDNQVIDLRQGSMSSVGGLIGNVGIGVGAVIENAIGGSGNDTFRGNSADNRFTLNAGNDTVDGGLGSDTVIFSGARSLYTISWNGQVGTVTGNGQTVTVTNVEFLQFSDQTVAAAPTGGLIVAGDMTSETINGSALADMIGGAGGNDVINGLAGNDFLSGGSGNDILNGGDGDDVLAGDGGDDALNGGAGFDVADYSSAGAAVNVNLALGTSSGAAGSDTFNSIEGINGSAHNDILVGDANANVIRGGGGVDNISGGGGNDRLYAGAPANTGGAPDVLKGQGEVISTIATAKSLTGAFDLLARAGVENATSIPHATVVATASGQLEYYSFTVVAGDVVRFDIDGASFDAGLRLFDASGVELAQNDDPTAAERDGSGNTDSELTFTFTTAGTYYIQVVQYSSTGTGIDFPSAPAPAGGRYQLNVSIPSAPAQPDVFIGSTLNGDAGNDYLEGGIGADTLNGGADNDVLVCGAGDDTINGGDGYDVAVYSGAHRNYSAVSSSGVTGGREGGTDTITGVEALAFVDGQLSFHRDGQPAQVMRLYDSAFNRIPDASGFEAQLDAMEGGLSLEALAQRFVDSVEFQNTYGALNNQQFVERLYLNVLDRAGDSGGIANALNQLNSGAMTRSQLLVAFSESSEHKDLTQGTLDDGLWVADEQTLQIARMFDSTYGRLPDEAGLITWRNALGAGMSLAAIAEAFAGSAEFASTYGALNDRQFAERLYLNVLDRTADEPGIQNVTNLLANGTTRAQILLAFSESAEHIALTREMWIGGVPTSGGAATAIAVEDVSVKGGEPEPLVQPMVDDHSVKHELANDEALVLPAVEDDGFLVSAKELDALIRPIVDVEPTIEFKDMDAQIQPGVGDNGAGHVSPVLQPHQFDNHFDDYFLNIEKAAWFH